MEKTEKIIQMIDDLAIAMANQFTRLEEKMDAGFANLNERVSAVELRLDRIEYHHTRRLDILEARTNVLKEASEKGLGTTIIW